MHNHAKENASGQAGVGVAGGPASATKQKKALNCGSHHINNLVREIREAGLQLRSTEADTQLTTLPRVLQYLGARGLSTYEGVALGYLRVATRIKELRDVWEIHSLREDVIGPDGLFHKGVARYVLVGKRQKPPLCQGTLDLEVRA